MLKRGFIGLLLAIPLIASVFSAAFYVQYRSHVAEAELTGTAPMDPLTYANYALEELQAKQAGWTQSAGFDASSVLPPAPEGWDRRGYAPVDGEKITGVLDEAGAPGVHTELEIQNGFRALKKAGAEAAAVSYLNDTQIVSLWLKPSAGLAPTSWEEQTPVEAEDQEVRTPYVTVGGVEIAQLPQVSRHFVKDLERPAAYRRFQGNIGANYELFVFSNAGDDALKPLLKGIDIAALESVSVPAVPSPAHTDAPLPVEDTTVAAGAVLDQPPPSLASRISKLFATKASDDETEAPRRMTCKMRKGAKHCYFPEED